METLGSLENGAYPQQGKGMLTISQSHSIA